LALLPGGPSARHTISSGGGSTIERSFVQSERAAIIKLRPSARADCYGVINHYLNCRIPNTVVESLFSGPAARSPPSKKLISKDARILFHRKPEVKERPVGRPIGAETQEREATNQNARTNYPDELGIKLSAHRIS
jgi:hypothetical protein